MSSRGISKRFRRKLADPDKLLAALLSSSKMPSCASCDRSSNPDRCCASSVDSSRCVDCVRMNLHNCDMLGPTNEELIKIARQQEKAEADLEAAADELEEVRRRTDREMAAASAKFRRLQSEKKKWAQRVTRMVRRGITSLEELDRIERLEAEGQQISVATVAPAPDLPPPLSDEDFARLVNENMLRFVDDPLLVQAASAEGFASPFSSS